MTERRPGGQLMDLFRSGIRIQDGMLVLLRIWLSSDCQFEGNSRLLDGNLTGPIHTMVIKSSNTSIHSFETHLKFILISQKKYKNDQTSVMPIFWLVLKSQKAENSFSPPEPSGSIAYRLFLSGFLSILANLISWQSGYTSTNTTLGVTYLYIQFDLMAIRVHIYKYNTWSYIFIHSI